MLIRYLAARWRHRGPFAVRYLRMGLGLENRARLLAPFWANHIERSRAAQARWAEGKRGEWLTVLGAGRLLDFNRSALLPGFANLRLVDADPLCERFWRDLKKPLDAVRVDMTGCLEAWFAGLSGLRLAWPDTLEFVRSLRAGPAYGTKSDAILSLNVLSQLPVVWQEGVEAILQRRFGRVFVEPHEGQWLDALRPAGQTLVERHLAALEDSWAAHLLLIADLEYFEYRGRMFDRRQFAPPPAEWSPAAGWMVNSGIDYELAPALEGVEMDEATLLRWLPSYRLAWQEHWLWHIAPLGTEKALHGTVHRVGAFCLERSC